MDQRIGKLMLKGLRDDIDRLYVTRKIRRERILAIIEDCNILEEYICVFINLFS